uniref:Uncharacterized protein n=1 Tax=Anguilla anguilla TaxID=7936 RepID=A0A0E9PQZ3_ANGAN
MQSRHALRRLTHVHTLLHRQHALREALSHTHTHTQTYMHMHSQHAIRETHTRTVYTHTFL